MTNVQEGGAPMAVDVKDEVAMDVTEDVKPKSFVSPGIKLSWYNFQNKKFKRKISMSNC